MEQGWFYAEGEKSVGPVSLETLIDALGRLPEPRDVFVWRSGFENWRAARDIPELAGRILKPRPVPVIPAPDPKFDRFTSDRFTSDQFTSYAGGSLSDDGFLTPDQTKRRWRGHLAAVVAVLAAAAIGAILGIAYAPRVLQSPAGPESGTAAAIPSAPDQPQAAADNKPPDAFPQMIADAYQIAIATDALVQKLWASIEPPALQAPVNYSTVSRRELEAYRLGVAAAEENAKAALDQYIALLKAERETLEEHAKSSGIAEGVRQEFLKGVDERHAAAIEVNTRMLSARADFYRALGSQQKVMIEQFGKYKVLPAGQFRFSNDTALKQFDAALADVTAASKQLDQLEDEVMKLRDVEQQKWKELATGDATGQQ